MGPIIFTFEGCCEVWTKLTWAERHPVPLRPNKPSWCDFSPSEGHVPQQAQTSIFHKPYTAAHTDFRRRWSEGDTIFYVCAFFWGRFRAFSSFSKALMTTAGSQEEKERKLNPGKAKNAHLCWRRRFHVLERVLHYKSHNWCFTLLSHKRTVANPFSELSFHFFMFEMDIIATPHLTSYSCGHQNR